MATLLSATLLFGLADGQRALACEDLVVSVRCRFDHLEQGVPKATELAELKAELEAWTVSDVSKVLAAVDSAARQGWYAAGFVAYEAAPAFDCAFAVPAEPAAPGTPHLPLAWFGLFAEAAPGAPLARKSVNRSELKGPPHEDSPRSPGAPLPAQSGPAWTCEIDASVHAGAVGAIRESIAEGDVYLVNYATRFRRRWSSTEDPFALYRQLVAGHAGGYHAYIETADWAVACGSPELFFELSAGEVTSRPMKGTAPRGRWSGEDVSNAERLRLSPKERAENVMVVDLVRNDLGRIAVPGSVAVPALWQVERHPTLWQLTSTVTAATPPDTTLDELFRALFPSGSVTGAPKVSAMKIIRDLEPSPRGVYCGALGLVQPAPASADASEGLSARFAVAIRTAVVDKALKVVEYGSGGGITWDSASAPEWNEVLVKTAALSNPPLLMSEDDGLLETMRFDPQGGQGARGVHNLRGHLDRLSASADYLGFPQPSAASEKIAAAVSGLSGPARVRLVFRRDGSIEVETLSLEATSPPKARVLCIEHESVRSSEIAWFHKTTDRRRYEELARRHPLADDVVLVNERGEVTETTRANLAVLLDGRWFTPPLDCALLPGVERARLLGTGRLAERVVSVDELCRAEAVATVSSLRGWQEAHVRARCHCLPTEANAGAGPRD